MARCGPCAGLNSPGQEIVPRDAEEVVAVTDGEVAEAIRLRSRWPGETVGFALTGGIVDRDVFAGVLAQAGYP